MTYPENLNILSLDTCGSTNSYLKQHYHLLQSRLPLLVTATEQTEGRGRDRRSWVSQPGKGLYTSLAFDIPTSNKLYLLALIAAISVIETLQEITGLRFQLKWPNDILFQSKKIAGILIENTIVENRLSCIVGIGINLNHQPEDFPPELRDRAISVKMAANLDKDITPEEINPILARYFFIRIGNLTGEKRDNIIAIANRYSRHLIDQPISFHQPYGDQKIQGIFKGIYHDGGMILENKDGSRTIHHSGEINHC